MENIDLVSEGGKAFDAVNKWLSDAKSSEYGFLTAAYFAFDQFNKGNRDPLAKLLTVASGKKAKRVKIIEGNKLVFLAPLKRLFKHVLPHVSAKFNPGSDFGVAWTISKAANATVNTAALETLGNYAALDKDEAISPFGKQFKEAFPTVTVEPKAKDEGEILKAKVESLRKWADKEGINLAHLVHALQAKPQA